jgi:hypothetical protein
MSHCTRVHGLLPVTNSLSHDPTKALKNTPDLRTDCGRVQRSSGGYKSGAVAGSFFRDLH